MHSLLFVCLKGLWFNIFMPAVYFILIYACYFNIYLLPMSYHICLFRLAMNCSHCDVQMYITVTAIHCFGFKLMLDQSHIIREV